MALLRPNATRLSLKYLRVSVFLQVSIFQLVSGNDDLIWFVAFNFKLNEFCCALIVGTVLPSFQVFFQGFFGELSPYCTTPSPWCSGSFCLLRQTFRVVKGHDPQAATWRKILLRHCNAILFQMSNGLSAWRPTGPNLTLFYQGEVWVQQKTKLVWSHRHETPWEWMDLAIYPYTYHNYGEHCQVRS